MLLKTLSRSFSLIQRQFHNTSVLKINNKAVEEIKIPVPWGHIAGCWWGSKENQPILALHGWQDNAGTWEPLLNLLPDHLSVLAIDFPGGGFSSHIPPFHNYSFLDSIVVVRRIQNYLKMDSVIILGHSGGSGTGFLFSSLFPECVKGYFGIDFLIYAYKNETKRIDRMIKIVDRKVELGLRDQSKNQSYSWEEARDAIVKGTRGSVSPVSAEIMMKRGVIKLDNGKVFFSRDHRIKSPTLESLNVSQIEELASSITTNVELVKATKSPFFDGGIKNCPHVIDIIKSKAESFNLHTIKGGHHLHMDQPEAIAPLFLNFLNKL